MQLVSFCTVSTSFRSPLFEVCRADADCERIDVSEYLPLARQRARFLSRARYPGEIIVVLENGALITGFCDGREIGIDPCPEERDSPYE